MIRFFSKAFNVILDLVFPPRCMFCGVFLKSSKYQMCHNCAKSPSFVVGQVCETCGIPQNSINRRCERCNDIKHYFEKCIPVFRYELDVRKSILNYKFNYCVQFASGYAELMERKLRVTIDVSKIDLISYAPMSSKGVWKREYNQCQLLAAELSSRLQIPVVNDLLLKVRKTVKQSTLSRSKRITNLKGSIEFNKGIGVDVTNKIILLVDDVYTTGSTADLCCKQFKDAGAKAVYVSTIAITIS